MQRSAADFEENNSKSVQPAIKFWKGEFVDIKIVVALTKVYDSKISS